ncbi:hypothetical protein [Stutzerimonas azotifigens]|uniref:hypothetical protein n=1 Tax=Stutzerimonas azotifigens TaxID=291995 RepID=UPI000417B9CB|nr:hypothetical protein [Stutzerimonas azotifigens]MBZ5755693.1 hypothetical protein [Pseudomonas sp. S5(2021)]
MSGQASAIRISRQTWQGLLDELAQARRQRQLVTYRALIERLELPPPAMRTLAAALEHLAALDARANRPLRSALVISQGAERLPRIGFFECAGRLGRFNGPVDGTAAASWHAGEVARVFDFDYPEVP